MTGGVGVGWGGEDGGKEWGRGRVGGWVGGGYASTECLERRIGRQSRATK